jgi:hypothetical protein
MASQGQQSILEKAVFVINTAGLLVYLAWLMSGTQRIFYTQDGVLYLLPCLLFFFVYAFLFRRRKQPDSSGGEAPHG